MVDLWFVPWIAVLMLASFVLGAMSMHQHLTGRWFPEESFRDWWRRMRAGSATPTGDDELARLREFVAAHDAVEHLIADHTDDRAAYNAAVERFDRAQSAVAGSATPTGDDDG
jgi:hypothetical protein